MTPQTTFAGNKSPFPDKLPEKPMQLKNIDASQMKPIYGTSVRLSLRNLAALRYIEYTKETTARDLSFGLEITSDQATSSLQSLLRSNRIIRRIERLEVGVVAFGNSIHHYSINRSHPDNIGIQ